MRILFLSMIICIALQACDHSRVYEQNFDFSERYWMVGEKPEFEFTIDKPADSYTLYGNIRNSSPSSSNTKRKLEVVRDSYVSGNVLHRIEIKGVGFQMNMESSLWKYKI